MGPTPAIMERSSRQLAADDAASGFGDGEVSTVWRRRLRVWVIREEKPRAPLVLVKAR
jgi:hypothetical protein